MARRYTHGDLAARLEAHRSALEAEGIAAKLGPERVARQLSYVQGQLASTPDTDPDPLAALRTVTQFRQVVRMVASGGFAEGTPLEPVCGLDGLIDVEASVRNAQLIEGALMPAPVGKQSLLSRLVAGRVHDRVDAMPRESDRQADQVELLRGAFRRMRDVRS